MSQQTIAVLGSNSFSGSHFVRHCLREGMAVIGVSRSPLPDDCFLPHRWDPPTDRFEFHQLDFNHQMEQILALLQQRQPAYVVNFAAQGMVAQSWQRPLDWYRTNTLAMVELHEGLRRLPGLKSFVQASTPEVYGSTSGWVSEDHPFRPSTPYAISKAACDMNLLAYAQAYQFPAVLTRSANVCGPGQQLYRIIPRAIWAALGGDPLTLDGEGLSERAFIHIEDVCVATLAAARQATPGSIYHLSTRNTVTIRGLIETICQSLGKPFEEVVRFGPPRLGQDLAYKLDSSKAGRELNWQPQIGLEQIVAETVSWMQRFREQLEQAPRSYQHKG
jgi:dTDP-glucose 4,6-dehydratase